MRGPVSAAGLLSLVAGPLLTVSVSSDYVASSVSVINPTCLDPVDNLTTLLPSDPFRPCLLADDCLAPHGQWTNFTNAGCSNWVCSLRVNCGCFAGLDTSCSPNETMFRKPGCNELVGFFRDMNCSWEPYLGPRPDGENEYQDYLDQCLLGCNDASAPHRVNLGWLHGLMLAATIGVLG